MKERWFEQEEFEAFSAKRCSITTAQIFVPLKRTIPARYRTQSDYKWSEKGSTSKIKWLYFVSRIVAHGRREQYLDQL